MDSGEVVVYAAYARNAELRQVLEVLEQAGFRREIIGLRLSSTHPDSTRWKDRDHAGSLGAAAFPQQLLHHSALVFFRCREVAESEWARQLLLHTGAIEVVCLECP
jgi:hypothetical protein